MIRVLIADDHTIVRRGLKEILSEIPDMSVAGEAASAQETLRKAQRSNYDVLILDITMPDRNGFDILKEIIHFRPNLPILVLSVHPEGQYAVRVLKSGAAGYLTKDCAPSELIGAIRKVVSGGKFVSPALAEMLAQRLQSDFSGKLYESLSDREYQVFYRIAKGDTVTEISHELSLSVKTVSTYRARLLGKLNKKSNAELIRYALKHQLVD